VRRAKPLTRDIAAAAACMCWMRGANAEQLDEHARAEAGREGEGARKPFTAPAHMLRLSRWMTP